MMDDKLQNPFPGLRAFEENEDILFFGREKQVDQLLKKLSTVRFLTVIGSPGSGKTSLVKSGLIPSLQSGSRLGSNWKICSFRVGDDPIGNMAKALSGNGVLYDYQSETDRHNNTSINESILRKNSSGLIDAYKQSEIDPKNKLLVLVDEFEDLFRFAKYETCMSLPLTQRDEYKLMQASLPLKNELYSNENEINKDKQDSVAFVDLLLKATQQRDLPIYVIFTMRSDYLGDCTRFDGLPEAINEGQYLVPRMTREEWSDAITGPIGVGRASISPGLLNQLLDDASDHPDQLSILQHALMRTWDFWKKQNEGKKTPGEINVEHYNNAGTVHHALSQHAEEAYDELVTPKSQQICEAIFRALTDKGSDSAGIRWPQQLRELCELANASEEEVIGVINIFRKKGRGFLMPPSEVPLVSSSIINISHESIMRIWERLVLWVDAENQSAQIYLRLCDAADLYEAGKGGLLRDPELQVAWKWKEENEPNAVWALRYNNFFDKAILFLEHSKEQFDKLLLFKEKVQKRSLRRARRTTIVISVIALGAFLLAIYSFELRNLANRQTVIAEKESVEAKRQKKLAEDHGRIAEKNKESALLSAKQAHEQKTIAEKEQENARSSEKNALLQKVIADQQKAYAERQKVISETNAAIAKQQQGIAETQTERAVSNEKIAVEQKQISSRLKDLAEARNLAYNAMLLLNDKQFTESKQEALGAYKLNANNNGPLQNSDIYTALQFNWVNAIQNKNQFSYHKYPVRSVAHGPAANHLISIDESGMVYLSKTVNGILEPISSYDVKDEARSVSTSPDGLKAVVVTATGNAVLLDLNRGGSSVKELGRASFSGTGRQVVFKSNSEFAVLSSKGVVIYQADPKIKELKFVNGAFTTMNYANGKLYVASGNKISVYNKLDDLPGNVAGTFTLPSKITSIAISPVDDYLAGGTYEGGVWIKDLKSTKAASSFTPHASAINDLKFNMVGNGLLQLASASSDQTIKLMDVKALVTSKNTENILTLRTHNKWVYCLWYSPDGKFLYTGSEDKKIVGWHTTMAGIYRSLNADKN